MNSASHVLSKNLSLSCNLHTGANGLNHSLNFTFAFNISFMPSMDGGGVEKNLVIKGMSGSVGIGHVRWATHGVPNEINAHPHSSEQVSVVHNGIIENSDEIKKELSKKGLKFKS